MYPPYRYPITSDTYHILLVPSPVMDTDIHMMNTEVTQKLFQIWGTPGERAGSFLTRTYEGFKDRGGMYE